MTWTFTEGLVEERPSLAALGLAPVLGWEALLGTLALGAPVARNVDHNRYLASGSPGRAPSVSAWAEMQSSGNAWAVRTDDVEDDYAELRQFTTATAARAYVQQNTRGPMRWLIFDFTKPPPLLEIQPSSKADPTMVLQSSAATGRGTFWPAWLLGIGALAALGYYVIKKGFS